MTDNEDDNAVTEDDVDEETTETVSANDLLEVEPVAEVEAKSGEVTEISYEAASGNGVQITAPYGRDNAARYSFTAPADGRYVFYTEEKASSYTYFRVYDEDFDEVKYNGTLSSYQYLNVKTDYMNQGERLYIETDTNNVQGEVYTLKVAGETSLTKAEDGRYNASLPGGDVISINVKAGYKRLKFEVQQTNGSGKYYIQPYYCLADHSTPDDRYSNIYVGNKKL